MTLTAVNDKFDIWCIYCIGYETFEVVKPLYIIFNKINGYIEDNNDN